MSTYKIKASKLNLERIRSKMNHLANLRISKLYKNWEKDPSVQHTKLETKETGKFS
jgi:hypothetical protein